MHLGELRPEIPQQGARLASALALVLERPLQRLELRVGLGQVAVQLASFLDPLARQRLDLRAGRLELLDQALVALERAARLGQLGAQLLVAIGPRPSQFLASAALGRQPARQLRQLCPRLLEARLERGPGAGGVGQRGLERLDPHLGLLELGLELGALPAPRVLLERGDLVAQLLELRQQALVGSLARRLVERLDALRQALERRRQLALLVRALARCRDGVLEGLELGAQVPLLRFEPPALLARALLLLEFDPERLDLRPRGLELPHRRARLLELGP